MPNLMPVVDDVTCYAMQRAVRGKLTASLAQSTTRLWRDSLVAARRKLLERPWTRPHRSSLPTVLTAWPGLAAVLPLLHKGMYTGRMKAL